MRLMFEKAQGYYLFSEFDRVTHAARAPRRSSIHFSN
jgi:hypothetical protein